MPTSRVLLGVTSALALAVAGCGSSGGSPETEARPTPTTSVGTAPAVPAAPETTTPTAPADRPIPLRTAIGQMVVTRYAGPEPTPSVLAALRDGRASGVTLFADNMPSEAVVRRAVRRLVRATEQGGRPRPLVLVDQEGGTVKRLDSIPPDLSAAEIGAARAPAAEARRQGRETGRALRGLGINVNLAPVADVPSRAATFLGTRAFSRSPTVVARAACGFVEGLQDEGVAATLKHFPGLGRAAGDTDLAAVTIDATARQIETDLAAYDRCGAGVDVVMLSSAAYPALGIPRQAVLVPRTYRLLADLGFRGVTVSDALDTPSFADVPRPARQAVQAGLDLLLYASGEAAARTSYSQLLADARAGRLPRDRVEDAAHRIAALKAELGQP